MREQRQCEADLPFLRHKMREREPNRLKVKTNVCSVLIKSSYTTKFLCGLGVFNSMWLTFYQF